MSFNFSRTEELRLIDEAIAAGKLRRIEYGEESASIKYIRTFFHLNTERMKRKNIKAGDAKRAHDREKKLQRIFDQENI